MRALSLTQPWASLVAMRAKIFETRSWSTGYRGPLAIHAAKGLSSVGGKRGVVAICMTDPFHRPFLAESLRRRAVDDTDDPVSWRELLPLGALVGTCVLVDVVSTTSAKSMLDVGIMNGVDLDGRAREELAFGDFSPGRFAWILEHAAPLEEPIAVNGALGLWEAPDEPQLELALRQLEEAQLTDRRCRVCGCTDTYACDDGCGWAAADMCTSCMPQAVPV